MITAASIGFLVAPLAAVAAVLVASRAPKRADPWGLLLGAGAASAAVGIINLDYYAGTCPQREIVERLPSGGIRIEGCGGFDPVPFFIVGAVLAVVAVVAYVRASVDDQRPNR